MRVSIPAFRQEHSWSCLIACLRMCFAYHGILVEERQILEVCRAEALGLSLDQAAAAARSLGFAAELRFENDLDWLMERVAYEDSVVIPLMMAPANNLITRHAAVLRGIDESGVLLLDPRSVVSGMSRSTTSTCHGPLWTEPPWSSPGRST